METDLVRLTVVPNEVAAEEIRSLLEVEGIASVKRLTDFGAGASDGLGRGEQEVLVRSADLKTARALIGER